MRRPPGRVPVHYLLMLVAIITTMLLRASHGFPIVFSATSLRHARRFFSLKAVTRMTSSMLEIQDVTLPGEPTREVHVLDTGPCTGRPIAPPIILIGGTAQVITSWQGHIQALGKNRRLIIYEARGQGRRTLLDLTQASLGTHIEDFRRIHAALQLNGPVDLCGFSFGGRVSLGVAAQAPELVRRLVLTGVPAERDAVGRLILQSWKAGRCFYAGGWDQEIKNRKGGKKVVLCQSLSLSPHTALRRGSLHEFAWNSMLACHGPAFLTKNEKKIPEWVDFIYRSNTVEGILSIVEQSQVYDVQDPMHTLQLAKQVVAPTLLLGGDEDRVASALEIERLAAEAGKGWDVVLFEGANHNCVFETPVAWAKEVVRFLSEG